MVLILFSAKTLHRTAFDKIKLWKTEYNIFFSNFKKELNKFNISYENFIENLKNYDSEAYTIFENIYPLIMAGENFSPENSLASITELKCQDWDLVPSDASA